MSDLMITVDKVDQAYVKVVMASFSEEIAKVSEFKTKCMAIQVASADDVKLMQDCASAKKVVAKLRTSINAKKKVLKEDSLRTGQVLDKIDKVLTETCKAIEDHLELQATFAERLEADRVRKLGEQRSKELAIYGEPLTTFEELGAMSDSMFDAYSMQIQRDAENKIAGERLRNERAQAEAKALSEKQEAEKAEQDRLRADNAKLAAENQRIQAELNEKRKAQEAENARIQAKKEALAKAGAGSQMLDFANQIEGIKVPIIEGEKQALESLSGILVRFVKYTREKYS